MWDDKHVYVSHLGDRSFQPTRLSFPVSEAKQATQPSQAYAPLPTVGSVEYRRRYDAANEYHDVNHRSSSQMKRDISTFGGALGLQPGDSRLVQPCTICLLSIPRKSAHHFNEAFSVDEKQPPGTVWVTDTSHLTTTINGGYRYL